MKITHVHLHTYSQYIFFSYRCDHVQIHSALRHNKKVIVEQVNNHSNQPNKYMQIRVNI